MSNHAEILKKIMATVKKVPIISPSANKIIQVINTDNISIAVIIKIIKKDSALTANILKTANSVFYGGRSEVASLEQAVPLMGIDEIINITVKNGVSNIFNSELKGYNSEVGDLWKHDLRTATISHAIARFSKNFIASEIAFTGGLLHDIGKAIISSYLGETSKHIINAIDQGKIRGFYEAERKLLGVDHAQVGFELARHWNLPDILTSIILYHHTPSKAPDNFKAIVYCVHLGDILAMMTGYGTGADSLSHPLDSRYTDFFDLSEDDLHQLVLEIDEKCEMRHDELFDDQ